LPFPCHTCAFFQFVCPLSSRQDAATATVTYVLIVVVITVIVAVIVAVAAATFS
jgi:hypothetical protein